MARARSRRRPGRQANDGAGRGRRPLPPAAPRADRRAERRAAWLRRRRWTALIVGTAAVLVVAGLVAAAVVLNQPPKPDATALRRAIQGGHAGQEVTFAGTLVSEPTNDGGHERFLVRDALGDTVELDYNVILGHTVPVHDGDSIVVHGQLYIDPGQAGVHCLHAQTSRGCPQPGWIQFAGTTYS